MCSNHLILRRVIWWGAMVLGALLLWAAFPPLGETSALVFALAPLLAVARHGGVRRSAWFAAGTGFLFWIGTLAWMPAIVKNGGPAILVVLGWLGLAAVCAAYWAAFGALSACLWRRSFPLVAVLGEAVLWAGLEWIRGWLFTGFAWQFLGTALVQVPMFLSPARWGGVYAVSFCVVLVNGVFATMIIRLWDQMCRARNFTAEVETEESALNNRSRRLLARWLKMLETAVPLALVLFLVVNGRKEIGTDHYPQTTDYTPTPVRLALVQRNAPCCFQQRTRDEEPLEVFRQLLQSATAARSDLIVFAESAMVEFGALQGPRAQAVAQMLLREVGGTALLAGGDAMCVTAEGERHFWNGAALYQVSNNVVQVYGKQHLVPFGEYIPLDKWITPLQKLSPIGVSLWPGEATVFSMPLRGKVIKIAPLICFEDTDPVLSRRAARLGADMLVLITNDSWFSNSIEPWQHAWQAVLRAVETGLPVVRVGNSGVTGIITPNGVARWLTDEGKPLVDARGTMVDTVCVNARGVNELDNSKLTVTPYVYCGDLPLACLWGIFVAWAVIPKTLINKFRKGVKLYAK